MTGQVPVSGGPGVQKKGVAGIGEVGDHTIPQRRAGSDTGTIGYPAEVGQKPCACGEDVGGAIYRHDQAVIIPNPDAVLTHNGNSLES